MPADASAQPDHPARQKCLEGWQSVPADEVKQFCFNTPVEFLLDEDFLDCIVEGGLDLESLPESSAYCVAEFRKSR